jgi:hypothetical protein
MRKEDNQSLSRKAGDMTIQGVVGAPVEGPRQVAPSLPTIEFNLKMRPIPSNGPSFGRFAEHIGQEMLKLYLSDASPGLSLYPPLSRNGSDRVPLSELT